MSTGAQQPSARDAAEPLAGQSPKDPHAEGARAAFLDEVRGSRMLAFQEAPKAGQDRAAQAIDVKNMDHIERVSFLANEAKTGKWSDDGQKVWSQIFTDIRKNKPGATTQEILGELQVKTVREINNAIAKDRKHFVQLAQTNEKNGADILSSNFFAQIYGGNVDMQSNALALRNNTERTDSSLRVGRIDWQAEKAEALAFQKQRKALVDVIKKDALGANSRWSTEGKKACKDLFDLLAKHNGPDQVKMKNALQSVSKEINDQGVRQGLTKNTVEPAAILSENGDIEFMMMMSQNAAERTATGEAIAKGVDKDNYIKVGTMDSPQKQDAFAQRGELLAKDAARGVWSDKSKQTWEVLFKEIAKTANITPQTMNTELNKFTNKINEALTRGGSGYRATVKSELDLKTAEVKFAIQLKLPDAATGKDFNEARNTEAFDTDKDIGTSVMIGRMKVKAREAPTRKDAA